MLMGQVKNFNYVFLFYDVGEKRVHKVFKVCKKYLNHYQKSVFRGSITPSNLIKMKNEIHHIIESEEDFISIIKLMSEHYFEEDVIGTKTNDTESFFL